MAKSGAQSLTFTSVTDRQTDRQKLNVFDRNSNATKLGMVMEDRENVLAPLKRLGVWGIISPLGGAENLGKTRHPQLKTPITP